MESHEFQTANTKPGRTAMWGVVFVLVAGLLIGVCGGLLFMRLRSQGVLAGPEGPTTEPSSEAAASDIEQLQHTLMDQVEQKKASAGLVTSGEELATRYPTNAAAQMLYGQILLNDQQFQPAYDQMVKSLTINPQQPEVEVLAGTIARDIQRLDLAEKHYRKAIELEPNSGRIRLHLAQLYFDQQMYDKAAVIASDVLANDSTSHQASAMIADVLQKKGDTIHALEMMQGAIEKVPLKETEMRGIYLRRKAAMLRQLGRPTESLQTLRQLTGKQTTTPPVLEEISESFAMLGKPDEAARVWDDAATLNPTNWRFSAGAAKWYLLAGDKEDAKRHIELIRAFNPRLSVIADLEEMMSKPIPAMTMPSTQPAK